MGILIKKLDNKFSHLSVLLLALVYGGFSSSTPDSLGIAEIFILLNLIFITLSCGKYIFYSRNHTMAFAVVMSFIAYLILVYLFRQNNFSSFLRDIVPMIYMTIPLFMSSVMKSNPKKFISVFELFF